MEWHARYLQQATWTKELRDYLFNQAGISEARSILEVGCGTGAVLTGLTPSTNVHGLDIDRQALLQCKINVQKSELTQGDALSLPYPEGQFEIVFCHFLLLWLSDPVKALLEMKRVTKQRGHILALAEPDHSARIDAPEELKILGQLQTEALSRQGADTGYGIKLDRHFREAGIQVIETGRIGQEVKRLLPPMDEHALEWSVVEFDLKDTIPETRLKELRTLDEKAWKRGVRILQIPTYFAWGRK